MAPAYKGTLAALEIGPDGGMTAVYPDAREAIERQAADVGKPAPGALMSSGRPVPSAPLTAQP
jgi:hypothetical protein